MVREEDTRIYYAEGASRIEAGRLLGMLPMAVIGYYLDDASVFMINEVALRIIGCDFDGVAKENPKMSDIICEEDIDRVMSACSEKNGGDKYHLEYRIKCADGRKLWITGCGIRTKINDGRVAVISVIMDISKHIIAERRLLEEAEHDSLTGIYNRKKAKSLIEQYILSGCNGMMFICDIDNFKLVNDTIGHIAGDDVLVELAGLMRLHLKDDAVIARFGGDEYMLFFPDKDAEVIDRMNMLRADFKACMKVKYPQLNISLSVGSAQGAKDFDTFYGEADKALYMAKKIKDVIKIYE